MLSHPKIGGRRAVHVVLLLGGLQAPASVYGQQTVGVPGNPLGAQSPLVAPASQRPFRGIFGPRKTTSTTTHQLDLRAAVYGLRSQIAGQSAQIPGDIQFQKGSNALGASAVLDYSAVLSNVSLSAYGSTVANYYVDFDDPVQMSYAGGIGVTGQFGKTTVSANQSVQYTPFYGLYPYAGLLPVAPADVPVAVPHDHYAAGPGNSLGLVSYARASRTIGRRSSVSGFFTLNRTTFSNDPDYVSNLAGFTYSHGLTRHSSFRAGYSYQDGSYGPHATAVGLQGNHNIDVGIDYGRALSPWRRTTISFGTGSTLTQRLDDPSNAPVPADTPLTFYITGFAAINRELGRTWNVRATYNRSVSYVPGFVAPFFSDGVSAAAGGALGSRLTVSLQASGTRGSVGLPPSDVSASQYGNNMWAYTASGTAQYGLGRHFALYATYVYWDYLFGHSVSLPAGLLPDSGRQSIQGGLTTWWPLFRR
jgi:hypothetical protein